MKKILFLVLNFITIVGYSQAYEFTTVKDNTCLPVISQGKTGTCWSFSTVSFLESEITRVSGKSIDLSEMYNVRMIYPEKGMNYVLRQGKANFSEGGLAHDVIYSAIKHGLVPASAYNAKTIEKVIYDHSEMVVLLEKVVNEAVANPTNRITWKNDFNEILNTTIGSSVESFTYNGKTFTPKQFVAETKLNLNDYVTITSFTHEPMYSKFILSVPDNFSNGNFYNVNLDEFVSVIDNALDKGYTLVLDTDVSEKTFNNGIAVIPNNPEDEAICISEIKPEKKITTEMRQPEFENYNTTDDHLMHIVGKAKDQKGNLYYKVKNTWGEESGKDGFVYMSVAYIKLKGISVLLHKNSLPTELKTKLQIL